MHTRYEYYHTLNAFKWKIIGLNMVVKCVEGMANSHCRKKVVGRLVHVDQNWTKQLPFDDINNNQSMKKDEHILYPYLFHQHPRWIRRVLIKFDAYLT